MLARLAVWNDPAIHSGPVHMATDELLPRENGPPVLRLYRWARPEITFGYPQRWSDVEPLAGDRPATRRWTGGGLVEHGADLTITLAVPANESLAGLPPTESYRTIHTAIRNALASAEPTIRLATAAEAHPGLACFTSPACLDVLFNGQKIVGGAQRRTRAGLLYQGSLQKLDPPADFAEKLALALALEFTPLDPTLAPDPADVAHLAASRYANPIWNSTRRVPVVR